MFWGSDVNSRKGERTSRARGDGEEEGDKDRTKSRQPAEALLIKQATPTNKSAAPPPPDIRRGTACQQR
ncbi:hypothetical protein Dda_2806 [Drechslerella dactyloides]|uniref:Uncharacterized protein n=1 Tax=Drechslerella dactyloides TaxID=74499 RepID=A0AAD6J2G9_DREDA|nr:hypothetical protein Dda_2806 [Drechslerella dactyloides]